ncbi:MAG: ribokinase [Planctomycetes bacterium]|nr:ribokinase [Planctomycetota bacterium]
MSRPVIIVAGSANLDLVVRVARFPAPGETLGGATFATYPGGKGANQAVAAARLGAKVRFVGAVGVDPQGEQLRASLERERIDTGGLEADPELPTGVASIVVRRDGENQIVVAPGANSCLSPARVEERLDGADSLLLQLETPLSAVIASARAAHRRGVPVVLNAAPAKDLPDELLRCLSVLVVNRLEAAQLIGVPLGGRGPDPAELAARLRRRGAAQVVITLGPEGALWADGEGVLLQPSFHVEAVDATGAGDAFVGALATLLAEGAPPSQAMRFACAAASLACGLPGAQASLPRRAAVLRRISPPAAG